MTLPGRGFLGVIAGTLLMFGQSSAAVAPPNAATIITDRLPGVVQGVGTYFAIEDDDDLNAVIESTAAVRLQAQSISGSLMLLIEPINAAASTTITIRNLAPSRTYYQYLDDFERLSEIITDEQGSVSFALDTAQPHAVFIQAQKSTVFLRDDATGGDCPRIGIWDAVTNTCLFTTDTSEVIQFANDGLTLDGQGNTFTGWNIYAPLRTNVTVKNVRLSNNRGALFFYRANDSAIENVTIERASGNGIQLSLSQRNRITNSNITVTQIGAAILLDSTTDTTITGTTVASDVRGIDITFGSRNILTGNIITPMVDAIDYGSGLLDSGKGGVRINYSRDNVAYGNRFVDNIIQAQVRGTSSGNVFDRPAPDGGNYWSNFDEPAEGCVDGNHDWFCDVPYVFTGGQDNLPRLNNVAGAMDGPPTVLFIPGLQGSRLYTSGMIAENKLWEPNRNADVEKLFMNEAGESISPGIYTRDVIDAAFGYNIYQTFLAFLDDLAEEETITAWRNVPYDWRLDVDQHVPAMTAALVDLIGQAPRSPVTIIAHSNGGLIAKELLQELERQKAAGESDLIDSVDRLILVATPQLGTPKTIASLLHGYDLDYMKGLVLSQATARRLAEFMPSAFNLLPSATYFERVADPVVEFDRSVEGFAPFAVLFGSSVNTAAELRQLAMGGNGAWSKPAAADVVTPNVLQSSFLDSAASKQQELEQWSPPEHIEVIQVAGWGLDTVKTIKYTAKPSSACITPVSTFCRDGFLLDYRPVFTVDGDRTVVVPSTVAMSENKYYVNLHDYNREFILNLRRNREHADILEARPVQNLISNLLQDIITLPEHVTDFQPESNEESKRLRVSVHSPVSLSVVDEFGNRTGLMANSDPLSDLTRVQEDIPNSYYMEFGEGKYVGFDADEPHTITLEGQEFGTFDLDIEEITGETTNALLSYEDVPVMEGSIAELSLQTVGDAASLNLDMDGNGEFETAVSPGEQLTPSQLIDALSVMINSLNLKHGDQTNIQAHLRNAQKKISVASQLKNVEKTITRAAGKSITQDEAAVVLEVLSLIKVQLGI